MLAVSVCMWCAPLGEVACAEASCPAGSAAAGVWCSQARGVAGAR